MHDRRNVVQTGEDQQGTENQEQAAKGNFRAQIDDHIGFGDVHPEGSGQKDKAQYQEHQ